MKRNCGEVLNAGIGQVSIEERLVRVVYDLKTHACDEKEVKEIIVETKNIFLRDWSDKNRGTNNVYCSSNYFLELYKLLRGEIEMCRETVVGHNIIDDTLDKVLALMAEMLQMECIEGNVCVSDAVLIATWIYTNVSRNHLGKANTLLRTCGERLIRDKSQDELLAMINCNSESPNSDELLALDRLEEAQNLVALGLISRLGSKKVINGFLESESKAGEIQTVVEHLQDVAKNVARRESRAYTEIDDAKRWLYALSICPGWDMEKVKTWVKKELPDLEIYKV